MGSKTATTLSEQMEMDYEALAAIKAEQAAKDAEQAAMQKIWEDQNYVNNWPGVEVDYYSESDENLRYNTPPTGFINDFGSFDEPPLATPSNPTPSNPTSANPTPANPTPANPTPTNPTSTNPTYANPTPRTRSKRKQPANLVVPKVFYKQRGRSERISKMQGKNYKFDEKGTGSTPDKDFLVSKSEFK
ncbi:hypothetical protein Tco_1170599 [Tanacetum coccineum]